MKLCSACLLGVKCRYDGKNNLDKAPSNLIKEYKKGKLIPVCPEQLGGLQTPRPGSYMNKGDGHDVLDGKSIMINTKNKDVSNQFIRGAQETLKIAQDLGIKEAIFKQRSPSCGCGQTHSGPTPKSIAKGDGVANALLKRNGIRIITEEDL